MSNNIIEVKDISKKYLIDHERGGYVTLRDVLANVIHKPFAFAKTKAKRAVGLEKREDFWALKGISFNVQKGEVIGIIGRNGAGKSTLLKILSQITPPTEGEIILRGRVGSLLEVGTGFHPELTGRENIFLNGAILGMKRTEIVRKFDAIVEFAGIGKFLDTPVKRYSSGMYVRLAFSVAAHMEPDILIVDEVLAVGDAEFQKKCLGKMQEVTRTEGRTILFVSHNLAAIQSLCPKTVLLEGGKIKMSGETKLVIDCYLKNVVTLNAITRYDDSGRDAQITSISILDKDGRPNAQPVISKEFYIQIEYTIRKKIEDAVTSILIVGPGDIPLLKSTEGDANGKTIDYSPGRYKTEIKIPAFLFNVGNYNIEASIQRPNIEYLDKKDNINFEITNADNPKSAVLRGKDIGKLSCILEYKTQKHGLSDDS